MKRILLLLVICIASQAMSFAQTTETKKGGIESSFIASYYHAFGNVVSTYNGSTNGVLIGYYGDYVIPNTPVFLGFGLAVGFNTYSKASDSFKNRIIGIPLTLGFKANISNIVKLKPFMRFMPMYSGYELDKGGQKSAFGGVVPELGAMVTISHLVLSCSLGFSWDSYKDPWEYSRLGEFGMNIGVGYKF